VAAIAGATGRGVKSVRRVLVDSGVQLRPPGAHPQVSGRAVAALPPGQAAMIARRLVREHAAARMRARPWGAASDGRSWRDALLGSCRPTHGSCWPTWCGPASDGTRRGWRRRRRGGLPPTWSGRDAPGETGPAPRAGPGCSALPAPPASRRARPRGHHRGDPASAPPADPAATTRNLLRRLDRVRLSAGRIDAGTGPPTRVPDLQAALTSTIAVLAELATDLDHVSAPDAPRAAPTAGTRGAMRRGSATGGSGSSPALPHRAAQLSSMAQVSPTATTTRSASVSQSSGIGSANAPIATGSLTGVRVSRSVRTVRRAAATRVAGCAGCGRRTARARTCWGRRTTGRPAASACRARSGSGRAGSLASRQVRTVGRGDRGLLHLGYLSPIDYEAHLSAETAT
jgi:hypothetical protein